MVTSIVLLSILVPSRHTGIGAWVNSKMYISILYNIISCHARVFYGKKTNPDLLSIPGLWGGKTNTEYTGSLGYNSVFRVCCLSFPGMCILLFLFLSLCRFCVFVFFFCSHWSLVDVPLIFLCPADHVPDWQPRILLGMVEARSVNVKKTLHL